MASKLDVARQYILENYNQGADFRWDVLSRKLQVRSFSPQGGPSVSETNGRSGEAGLSAQRSSCQWQDLDTRMINSIACACATERQVNVTDREVRIVLNSEDIPAVNPLRDYVYNLEEYNPDDHNGHSFIDWLSDQVTVKDKKNSLNMSSQAFWKQCFRKWFVAMVASWLFDEVVNQEVLILIGRQGIYKTTWLEHLLPPCLRAYGTKMSNPHDLNKDERLKLAEYGIIFLDEIDALTPRELNQFKSVITSIEVDERAAYAYTKEKRVRVASFCGSGNNPQFLTDDTGNRRWLPFEVESIENPFNWNSDVFPYAQIYGEALYLVRHGFNYWFDLEEIQVLEIHQEDNKMPVTEEQLLPVYFSPANPGDAGALFMSASEILALLVSYGNIRNPMQNNKFGALLKSKGFVRRDYKKRHGYVVLQNLDIDNQRKLQAREATDA